MVALMCNLYLDLVVETFMQQWIVGMRTLTSKSTMFSVVTGSICRGTTKLCCLYHCEMGLTNFKGLSTLHRLYQGKRCALRITAKKQVQAKFRICCKFITEFQSVETRVITKYSCILVGIQAFSTVQSSSKQSATCMALASRSQTLFLRTALID